MFSFITWKNTFKLSKEKNIFDSAVVLGYTSLLGIVPMMAIMATIFSITPYFSTTEDYILNNILPYIIPESQSIVIEYIKKFSHNATSLAIPSFLVMLFIIIMLLWEIDTKLNNLFCEKKEKRSWWLSLIHYFGISFFGPIVLGMVVLAIFSILSSGYVDPHQKVYPIVFSSFLVISLLFSLYKIVPEIKVPLEVAFFASIMAFVELSLLNIGFSYYIKLFPTYKLIYGAFAVVPLFLIWIYLSWFIILFNGAFVSVVSCSKLGK